MLRYAISGGALTGADGPDADRLVARCGELAAEGVGFVLLREKRLGAGDLARLTRRVVDRVRGCGMTGAGMRVIVPGRADVALAGGAAGVHLTAAAGELRVPQVRLVFTDAWVSVSCHTLDEVRQASEGGANAVLFGPVFSKVVEGVEVMPGVGLDRLREACAEARRVPVFALGSVSEANAGECLGAGAGGVAGIRMFFAG